MSGISEEIRKAVLAIMRDKIPLVATWCKVKSVSEQDKTCSVFVDEDDELSIDGILLGYDKSGALVIPAQGKDVLVLFVDNTKTTGAVLMVEESTKMELMGGKFGGVPKVESVTSEINDLRKQIQDLKTVFSTWVPVPTDGGAALKTAVTAWALVPLLPIVKTAIENQFVKHGDGK